MCAIWSPDLRGMCAMCANPKRGSKKRKAAALAKQESALNWGGFDDTKVGRAQLATCAEIALGHSS